MKIRVLGLGLDASVASEKSTAVVSKSPEWLFHVYVRKSAFNSCCGRNASGATATSNLGISLGDYQISNTLILPWHLHTQQHPGGLLWVSFCQLSSITISVKENKPKTIHGKRAVKENQDKLDSQKALG